MLNIIIFLSLSLLINGYLINSIAINQLKSMKVNRFKLSMNINEDNGNINNTEINNSNGGITPDIKAEGYLGSDLSTLDNDKQSRVLLYIGIALLPCLFLIPFVMSRDFVPPTDDVSPFGF